MKARRSILPAIALMFLFSGSPAATDDVDSAADRRERVREVRALLKESIRLIAGEEFDSALVTLEGVKGLDPKNADARYHRARVLTRRGDFPGAMESLAEGIVAAPFSSRLKLFLARLKIETGAPDEALNLVESVLAIKPREVEALYLKGLIFAERGELDDALKVWGIALDLKLGGQGS